MDKTFCVFASSPLARSGERRHFLVDMGGKCWLVWRLDLGYAHQWKDGSRVSIPYASDGQLDWKAANVESHVSLSENMPDDLTEKIWDGVTFREMMGA